MTERQTEFVPGRRAKDEERGRELTVESLDRGIVRLKEFERGTWSGGLRDGDFVCFVCLLLFGLVFFCKALRAPT